MNRVSVETLGRLLADGLEDLVLQHWAEVEEPESGAVLHIDYDRLMQLEKLGCFVSFGARRDGRLVGYSGFFVGPALHTTATHATNDVVFVEKASRGRLGLKLITEAEAHFRGCGIAKVTYHTKLAPILGSGCFRASVGRLLERIGYEHIEAVHAKQLGPDHGRRRR